MTIKMKNTYIHETHTIHSSDGKVHLCTESNELVFNAQNLLSDIPILLYFAIKEVNEQNEQLIERIQETLKDLK